MTGWRGALETLARRDKVKEVLERQRMERAELVGNRQAKYIDSRPSPIQKPAGGTAMMVRIKQDRGATMGRTRGPAHPQRTHSKSVNPASILGIAYSPTARSMDAIKGADLVEVHPWRLLALCGSRDRAVNVAAIHAMKSLGREQMCDALAGGYRELIGKILGEVRDPTAEIRAAMAQALGVLAMKGDEDVIEELVLATEDENDYVRASALSSLALIAPRESSSDHCTTVPVQTAIARLDDGDPDVREAAVLAVGALAPVGDKLAVEMVLAALEDANPTVNEAAVDGLILLGDVHELEDGDNQLLEIADAGVQLSPQVSDGADNWILSVAIEPEITLKGTNGPVQALQYWITLFGVQDFEDRVKGFVTDGRSKLLALVEDSLAVIEGDIETDARLVFWWPAGARRVLFQTTGDWAWEYRKQCRYCKGYSYVDADTGEPLFGSDLSFDGYFFVETENDWSTVFLRGINGGMRQELAKFPIPIVHEQPLAERSFSSKAAQPLIFTCTHNFQIDTDIVGGCSALLVLRVIQQVDASETKPLPPAPVPTVLPTLGKAMPGFSRGKILSTIVSLANTGSWPMQISHALLSESHLTWHSDDLLLIDLEEDLGNRNRKHSGSYNTGVISPLQPTRAQVFSGKDAFYAKGSLTLRTRHSNVEQRIIGGILARLESENLAVRNAAIDAMHNFIGFGNLDAVEGVLRRLQHPDLKVRSTAVTALKAVAEVGHVQALQGCLNRTQSKESFIRASSLEAFCALCPSSDGRLIEVLQKMIDDEDVLVRNTAEGLLYDFKRSRKAKDWEASEASLKILDANEYYHHWHSHERELVARQQGPAKVVNTEFQEASQLQAVDGGAKQSGAGANSASRGQDTDKPGHLLSTRGVKFEGGWQPDASSLESISRPATSDRSREEGAPEGQ